MKKLRRMLPLSVVLLAASMIVLAPATYADSTNTVVNISGAVTDTTIPTPTNPSFGTVTVRAHASGIKLLSGAGTDSPPPSSRGNPAMCQWPVTGSFNGSSVTLTGVVTQSSVHMEIGTLVTLTADPSSGMIIWVFGPNPNMPGMPSHTFTGTGTVDIRTA
jgi:hypothetical protein